MTTPDAHPTANPDPDASEAHDAPGIGQAGAPDGTLGGYYEVHNRPPAFEGPDGHPYTVSPEVEKTGDLRAPYHGFLVFPKWAETGVGIVGHVESPNLVRARTTEEATAALGALELVEVQGILDRAVAAAALHDSPPSDD